MAFQTEGGASAEAGGCEEGQGSTRHTPDNSPLCSVLGACLGQLNQHFEAF